MEFILDVLLFAVGHMILSMRNVVQSLSLKFGENGLHVKFDQTGLVKLRYKIAIKYQRTRTSCQSIGCEDKCPNKTIEREACIMPKLCNSRFTLINASDGPICLRVATTQRAFSKPNIINNCKVGLTTQEKTNLFLGLPKESH